MFKSMIPKTADHKILLVILWFMLGTQINFIIVGALFIFNKLVSSSRSCEIIAKTN